MSTSQPESERAQENEREHSTTATVTVDNIQHRIHRGSYLVTEFKERVGVDAALALDELVNGVLTPLADDQRVTIKGGEQFFSHARTGGSSC